MVTEDEYQWCEFFKIALHVILLLINVLCCFIYDNLVNSKMRWHPHGLYIQLKNDTSVLLTSKDGENNKKQEQRRESTFSKLGQKLKEDCYCYCLDEFFLSCQGFKDLFV